ncbi:MAG TPA: class I SAM-dependent methyltransferase family protein [bacterium]|nr:class I SAM-dependent methyltransferase family protein [bacterium]
MPLKTIDGIEYEVLTPAQVVVKKALINPLMNYVLPKSLVLYGINKSRSPLLKESILRPGGWRSMEISYENGPHVDWVDMLALKFSTFPMSLRNRRKLVARVICGLINHYAAAGHVNILGIGAGTGTNVMSGMAQSGKKNVSAHLIDLDSDAFEYGQGLCRKYGLHEDAVSFIEGDAVDIKSHIKVTPQIVKLVGIIEYLSDDEVRKLLAVSRDALPRGGSILSHSISRAHGVDRFTRRIFNLNLTYRSDTRVMELMGEAGFGDFRVRHEPLGVYSVIVGVKK